MSGLPTATGGSPPCGAGVSGSIRHDPSANAVEWLSDNGSPYTAKETLDFAAALDLVPCFSPVHSPESNGIAEAFVKTFKRDYARVHHLPNAATVLRQIAGRFDDYNEGHPHSGLRIDLPGGVHSSSGQVAGCPVRRAQHHHRTPVRNRHRMPLRMLLLFYGGRLRPRVPGFRSTQCVD